MTKREIRNLENKIYWLIGILFSIIILFIAGAYIYAYDRPSNSNLQKQINALNNIKCETNICSSLDKSIDYVNDTMCTNTTCANLQHQINYKCDVSTCQQYYQYIYILNNTKCSNVTCSNLQTQINTKCNETTCTNLQTQVHGKCNETTCTNLQTQINTKCNETTCTNLQTQMNTKCNETTCTNLQTQMNTKCNETTCTNLQTQMNTKCNETTCTNLQTQVHEKCNETTCTNLQTQMNELETFITDITGDLTNCNETTCFQILSRLKTLNESIITISHPPYCQSFYNGLGMDGNSTIVPATVTISTIKKWFQYSASSLEICRNITFSSGSFIVGIAGLYIVQWDLAIESGSSSRDVRISIFKNGILQWSSIKVVITQSGMNNYLFIATSNLISCQVGDVITFYVMNFSAIVNIEIAHSTEIMWLLSS